MHDLNRTQTRHHAAIGGVARTWAHLENYLQSVLWRIAGLDDTTGRCITQHMPLGNVWNAIRTVANETPKYQPLKAELKSLHEDCEKLRLRRNEIVHGLWGIFVRPAGDYSEPDVQRFDEFESMTVQARGELRIRITRTSIGKIDDLTEEILAFSSRLAAFAEANLPQLPDERPDGLAGSVER